MNNAYDRVWMIRGNNSLFWQDTSARPEVRGTANVGWRSLIPLPFNPPRTHSRLYYDMCLRTEGQ